MGDGEKSDQVAVPDKEKNPFSVRIKVARQGHHESNQRALPGWYIIGVRHYLSWQSWPTPKTRATGPHAVPYPARLIPARTAAVCLSCWAALILPGPARCSRDTAMVAVFRLASFPPPTGNRPPFRALSQLTACPREGGRSEAGGGSWPQWPERAPLQGAKVTSRISGESEPLMRRASESLNVRPKYDQQRRTRCGALCEE